MTEDDWRLTNQENYLKGKSLKLKIYTKSSEEWDHDHCEFCLEKFMEPSNTGTQHQGYTTEDNYYWICTTCYEDFKEKFNWQVTK